MIFFSHYEQFYSHLFCFSGATAVYSTTRGGEKSPNYVVLFWEAWVRNCILTKNHLQVILYNDKILSSITYYIINLSSTLLHLAEKYSFVVGGKDDFVLSLLQRECWLFGKSVPCSLLNKFSDSWTWSKKCHDKGSSAC